MFHTILIANRGEIACRIIRTARAMGMRCIAVHSDADAHAPHVRLADRAVPIGGASPQESYLRGDRIIQAARDTGAQAIHPGYGFLSENAEFAHAVAAAGLVFVGPSPEALRAMGLKDRAKALMADAGVPVVPGYHGADQDAALLAEQAAHIGYPVLIKAVAGGGGKGMRRVDEAADFAAALAAAKREAENAFGNDAVLIEKYILKPRHIEIQVFGDGNDAVHLYERDCSLQRRHQKVIEEAPAPGMTPKMRDAMGQAAVRAARAIGYAGAGTVEFIVDGSEGLHPDRFWFMEMNTRLQVEHPVTEAVTGIDLVAWQLQVAAGAPLPLRQDQITLTGHAMEARLYAEDVPAGFLPATGRLTHLHFPQGARVDTGVSQGDSITPWYDPMIAKIITHGPDRRTALSRLQSALAATEIAGCVTNLGFLGALLRHERFGAGDVDTGLIAQDIDALTSLPTIDAAELALSGIAALGLDDAGDPLAGFSLWAPLWHAVRLIAGEATHDLSVSLGAPGCIRARIDGADITLERRGADWWCGEVRLQARAHRIGAQVYLFGPDPRVFDLPDPLARTAGADASDGVITAPMPGLVKSVLVGSGHQVAEGDALAIMEAMKMEITLSAPFTGRVGELTVSEGAQVEAGAPLMRLEAENSPEA